MDTVRLARRESGYRDDCCHRDEVSRLRIAATIRSKSKQARCDLVSLCWLHEAARVGSRLSEVNRLTDAGMEARGSIGLGRDSMSATGAGFCHRDVVFRLRAGVTVRSKNRVTVSFAG